MLQKVTWTNNMQYWYRTIRTKLRCKRHRWRLSHDISLHLRILYCSFFIPHIFSFVISNPSFFVFIRSSVSQKCKHCCIQRCPCLVAAWKSIVVICSTSPCPCLSWSETEHSPQRSGGSLKPQAPKRKLSSLPHSMRPARKEWWDMLRENYGLWNTNT